MTPSPDEKRLQAKALQRIDELFYMPSTAASTIMCRLVQQAFQYYLMPDSNAVEATLTYQR